MPTNMISGTDEFWSSDPVVQQTSSLSKFGNLAVGIGVLGGGIYAARNTPTGSTGNLLDHVQNVVRYTGYSSPFALLNTFRAAEFLSPYVSTGSHQLGLQNSIIDPGRKVVQYSFESRFLEKEVTREALFHQFPALQELSEKNPLYQFQLNEGKLDLVFEADPTSNQGSLYLRNVESRDAPQLISNKVSLFEMRSAEIDSGSPLKGASKVNPAMKAVFQASGFIDDLENIAEDRKAKADSLLEGLGTAKTGDIQEAKRFMFIETPGLDRHGLNFARSFPAYGMERINRLVAGTIEQVPVLGKIASGIDSVYGFSRIKSGTASKMFARYGMRAGALGATAVGIAQIDHYRRQLSLPGELGASAVFGVGAAFAAKKLFPSRLSAPAAAAVGIGTFAAQMIMPGFDQGFVPGLATTLANLDVATTAVGELTFMNSYRRTVEGLMPGFSNPLTSTAVGIGFVLASGLGATDPLSAKIFRNLSRESKISLFGDKKSILDLDDLLPTKKKLHFMEIQKLSRGEFLTSTGEELLGGAFRGSMLGFEKDPKFTKPKFLEKGKVLKEMFRVASDTAGSDGVDALHKELYARYNMSLELKREMETVGNPFNKAYYDDIYDIERRVGTGEISKFQGRVEKVKSKVVNAFFGASFQGEEVIEDALTSRTKNYLGRYPALFLFGAIAHSFVSGGLLGSMKTATEKSAEYSGEKLVAVRRGRFWEGGGTPFAGRDIMYYRPHAYHTYMNRVEEKALYGEDEDTISPIGKFILENFTYELERRNYYNRPYPITGGAFENVPVIGNILAATIGQVIKPPKLMHVNDYMRVGPDGNIEYKVQPEIDRPDYMSGGLAHGAPVSPYSIGQVLTKTQYQFRELEGLTGWAKNMFQKAATGAETFGLDAPVMESASRMSSINERFWEMELGGAMFLSEPIRRFLPKERSQIMGYNPIVNQMPTWMPERFQHGDPYKNVKSGTSRMPGPGYAALHPELRGVNPEAYPDIYKYKILSDVAPTSKEFRAIREKLYARRAQGGMSEGEIKIMDRADKLVNEKMSGMDFGAEKNAYNIPVASTVGQAVYGGAVDLFKDTVSPLEYMIPMGFRPTQKLLKYSNPIDEYEYQRLYGTMFSFWDKPFRDWFRPAFYSAAHAMGFDGTPEYRSKANDVNEYFDKLEFVKQMQLAQQAEASGNSKAKERALRNAQRTRYGVNPQGSAMGMYQALPDGEKQFFDAFANAQGADRQRILEMVPADQKSLYENLYKRIDRGDPSLYPGGNADVDEMYLQQRFEQLDSYFQDKAMPRGDWIGWKEGADLNDIKVRYAEDLGMDLYDLDMYHSKMRAQARRGYLDNAQRPLFDGSTVPGHSGIRNALRNMINFESPNAFNNTNINVFNFGSQNRAHFYMNDNRSEEINRMMRYAHE